MDPLFEVHMLNEVGKGNARAIAVAFDNLLQILEKVCIAGPTSNTREFAIVKTKLEEACFFAKKAMALRPENQQ